MSHLLPSLDLTPIAERGLDLDQYFGVWAVEPDRFGQMLHQVGQMDLAQHVHVHIEQAQLKAAGDSKPLPYKVAYAADSGKAEAGTDIAVIDMIGTLTKRGSSLSAASSLIRLKQAVRAAARDPQIGGILLVIDSPGGTVAGTADLAAEVAAAAASKPVYALAEDLIASAAYWIGSQATQLFAANSPTLVGSIGTFIGLYDTSARAEKEGVKPVMIRTGAHKGAGFEGAAITDEQKAAWQAIVDKTQVEFSAGVARGRKLDAAKVNQLADGRVHVAADAVAVGLLDGIQSYDDTLAALSAEIRRKSTSNSNSKRKENFKMSESNTAPAPLAATFAELKAGLLGADAEFICAQQEKGATLAVAEKAWMVEQGQRLERARSEAIEAKAAVAKSAAKKPGVEPLGDGEGKAQRGEQGDPIAAWDAALTQKIERYKGDRMKATSALVREQPDLHSAYLAAHNIRK